MKKQKVSKMENENEIGNNEAVATGYTLEIEEEGKTRVWMNLEEFMNYLHDNNHQLYCEVLDYVSGSIANDHKLNLNWGDGDWDSDDMGNMAVCLTDKDLSDEKTKGE